MRNEVLQFYAEREIHVWKMIRRRPRNVTADQVKAGAAWFYSEYQKNGMNTHTRHMVWIIWARARDIASDEWAREEGAHFEALNEQIKGLREILNRKLSTRLRAWWRGVNLK